MLPFNLKVWTTPKQPPVGVGIGVGQVAVAAPKYLVTTLITIREYGSTLCRVGTSCTTYFDPLFLGTETTTSAKCHYEVLSVWNAEIEISINRQKADILAIASKYGSE